MSNNAHAEAKEPLLRIVRRPTIPKGQAWLIRLAAIIGSLVFGGLSIMRLYVPLGIPMQIYDIFPYLATVLVLIFTSIRQSREHAMPKHCGLNYFREER